MDIDNFSREAFESEAVSERANNAEFCTADDAREETFTSGQTNSELSPEVIETFSNVKKVFLVILVALGVVLGIRQIYCNGGHNNNHVPQDA